MADPYLKFHFKNFAKGMFELYRLDGLSVLSMVYFPHFRFSTPSNINANVSIFS